MRPSWPGPEEGWVTVEGCGCFRLKTVSEVLTCAAASYGCYCYCYCAMVTYRLYRWYC